MVSLALRKYLSFTPQKSRKEGQMSRNFKLTEEEINKAIMRSPYALPDSPGKAGLSASQIKRYFYDFIRSLGESLNIHFDEIDLSMTYFDEVINQINEKINELSNGKEDSSGSEGDGEVSQGTLDAHNTSATAHEDIREEIRTARSLSARAFDLAKGKNRIHVFASLEKMFEFIDIHRYYEDYGNADFEGVQEGDVFIIAQKGIPELAVLQLSMYEDEQTVEINDDNIGTTEFKAGGIYYYAKRKITLIGMEGDADTSTIVDMSQVQEKIDEHNESTASHSDLRAEIALKQNKLKAGDNITISDDGVISSTYETEETDISGKLDKATNTSDYAQAYIKNSDGTQALVNIKDECTTPTGNELVTGEAIANRINALEGYIEQAYLRNDASKTSLSQAYVKNADGTQSMVDLCVGLKPDSIVIRGANGSITVDYATNPTDAVPKYYVDSKIGEVDSVLDSIIAIQNTLIGGEA